MSGSDQERARVGDVPDAREAQILAGDSELLLSEVSIRHFRNKGTAKVAVRSRPSGIQRGALGASAPPVLGCFCTGLRPSR
jgi:hypothetical protein